MRGNTIIGKRIPNPISTQNHPFLLPSSSSFSTSSGSGGGGRGRGGSVPNYFDFGGRAPGKPESSEPEPPPPPPPQSGTGHGRGSPILPSFSSFISSLKHSNSQSSIGRGRGSAEPGPTRPPTESVPQKICDPSIPSSIQSAIPGIGRGKPDHKPDLPKPQVEENRHIRVRPKPVPRPRTEGTEASETKVQPKFSREEAVRRAVSILSKGESSDGRSEGGRGRGGGRGGGRGRGRGRREQRGRMDDPDEGYGTGLFLGDNADGEKLAEKVGVENMNELIEGFEEMSGRVLPSPMDDAYLDALHTNYMIEFEPEYLMGELDQNPDIDEKPPMPLRDFLEKVKPFIMAYEGFQSQQEWEEAVEHTMKNVPLFEEIVEYYSGPERVTAKKQQEELERVAKTIPVKAPASVKRFTDRAVLSLQSNPGWGFDKKCQFMDKLVREINQCYN